ncbi:senescence-specific cysteine protease sag39 [Cucumis melo var. makuwa]|uniref:Senescence-specific cysteine protease sag39 n=1 Tax=Cucumis melo var. makuwa TaxID=1194695 RepID=A0A5D3CUL7_CUCMM|nr:senescence-specific cysteine protease sag39 [Cucumis melo var. makuwa]
MRAMANQAPVRRAIPVSKVKILEPKPFCGVKDAKGLENFIFDIEQYFKATYIVTKEAKVTLAMMHLPEDAKLWWSSSPGRNRNSRPSSLKATEGDKCSGRDRMSYQSNTENTWQRPNNQSSPKRPLSFFICEGPHFVRECLNRADFYAFQVSLTPDSDDKSDQVEGEVD